eukprot:2619644-Lingulodinium_polyedra.AAC.1
MNAGDLNLRTSSASWPLHRRTVSSGTRLSRSKGPHFASKSLRRWSANGFWRSSGQARPWK